MTITKKIFESIVATAASATSQVYETLLPHFTEVEDKLSEELLGADIMNDLSVVPGLDRKVMELICLRTFAEQIPFLDLVLTDTGFGVVSNQNVAPASADRVQKLLQRCTDAYEDTYDSVLQMLVGVPEWVESSQAQANISSVIYTAKVLRLYSGSANAHRTDLRTLRPQIYQAEEKVMEHLSADFYYTLIEALRNNTPSKEQSFLIDMICRFIGFCLSKDYQAAKQLLLRIIDFAEKHCDDPHFADYKNSSIYKAKHLPNYSNEKSDTTFFFG